MAHSESPRGFADGHAGWFPAETIVSGTPPLGSAFQGIDIAWPAAPAALAGQ